RNCFWQEAAGEGKRSKVSEEAAMQDPLFAYIFGKDTSGQDKQAQQGHIVFFDAFPQSAPVIEPDIMNVHYPKYYGGTGLPVDYDSPKPIPFLTVGKCDVNGKPLHFRFYVACKKVEEQPEISGLMITKADGTLSSQSTVLDIVGYWLKDALTSHGIGAKTAVGYGYMKKLP
ncbi:MAG: type III-B CRISPR module RAMP protein Cmr6, partial [Saprospiraceae bacterium]